MDNPHSAHGQKTCLQDLIQEMNRKEFAVLIQNFNGN